MLKVAPCNLTSSAGFLKLPRFLTNGLPVLRNQASDCLKSVAISKIRWIKSDVFSRTLKISLKKDLGKISFKFCYIITVSYTHLTLPTTPYV